MYLLFLQIYKILSEVFNMVYYEKNAKKRKIDESILIQDVFVRKEFPIDFVVGTLNGFHGKFVNYKSDKYYYVLDGKAEVMIGDEYFEVVKGDFIHIPKETIHSINGKVKFIIICSPPYDFNYEEHLD